jgi:virginiamycin B lyase
VAVLSLLVTVGVGTSPAFGAAGNAQTVTEFALPDGASPFAIARGPDGNMWFLARSSSAPYGELWRITPTGQFTGYPVAGSSVTTGSDGNLWVVNASAIERVTPTGQVTTFSLPQCCGENSSTLGPDGNIWFTESLSTGGALGRITPGGHIKTFPTPGCQGFGAGGPMSLATGPDGNLWFTCGYSIGRMSTSGAVTQFPVSKTVGDGTLTAGPDGNIWFPEGGWPTGSSIGRITMTGQVLTPFPMQRIEGLSAGPGGQIWVTASPVTIYDGLVARVTTSGVFTKYRVPGPNVSGTGYLNEMAAGADGNMWFTNSYDESIGRISLPEDTTTSLTVPSDPVVQGAALTLSATVVAPDLSVTPTGSVQFTVDGTPLGSPVTVTNGQATLVTDAPTVSAGNHPVRAFYTSDGTPYDSESFLSYVDLRKPTAVHAQPAVAQTSASNPNVYVFNLDATLTFADGSSFGYTYYSLNMYDKSGNFLCTATNDPYGDRNYTTDASCSVQEDPAAAANLTASGGYTAVFAGDSRGAPSSGDAPLTGP